MQKKGCWLLLICFFFIGRLPDLLAAVADLKPHSVIVRSSFEGKIRVPVLRHHTYSLFTPGKIQEPYQPEFDFEIEGLPDNFSQNTTIGWLTKFSPPLARLFRGNNGRFENGVFFYQQNKLNKAENDLLALLNHPSAFKEKAILYLAWIKYKDQLWGETTKLLSYLLQSTDINLVKESHYLTSLVYLKQKKFQEVINLNESLRSRLPMDQFDLKQIYVHLICQIHLGSWSDAKSVSDMVLKKPIAHAKLFHKIIELSGLINYKNINYRSSLENYQRAKSYYAHPVFQFAMNRHIAWLEYLTGNYDAAIAILQDRKSHFFENYSEELNYLKLVCYVRLKKWASVNAILNEFEEGSLFHTYGSFLIRDLLTDPTEYTELFNQVSTQKFNFPEMKFHVALLDGNLFFKQKQYKKAKNAYIQAMSVDSTSSDYWIAQYNLGLTHLKLEQYDRAEQDFVNLMRTVHSAPTDRLKYHLIFAQYQQSKSDSSWSTLHPENFPSLSQEQHIELMLIQAATQLRLNKREEAKTVFLKIWQQTKQIEAFEFVVKIHYDQRQFDKAIKLIRDLPHHRSDTLVAYEVKSLLALRRFKEAKRSIDKIPENQDPFIALRLEVWAANGEYKSIINFVSGLLKRSLDRQQRRFYYLNLGDAYFNLQQYQQSKAQYYRALGLTKDDSLKSLVLYNIALSSYYHNDYTSFLSEVKLILKRPEISDEVRYNLTILLAEFYQKSNRLAQADKSLEQYSQSHSFNSASIHIKRIRISFQSNDHPNCMKLSKKGVSGENKYQRRDRIVMFGYCANAIYLPSETIKTIQLELKGDQNSYRVNELNFVLAQAYSQAKEFKKSLLLAQSLIIKPLNTNVRLDTQLLITQNLLRLNELKKAYKELGDVNQYKASGKYVRSLQLKSEIELLQKRHHQAYRTLLRIYYLSGSSKKDQQHALLRIAEGYLNEKKLGAAKKHFDKIDPEIIKKELSAQKRYNTLKIGISRKRSLSALDQFETNIEKLFHVKQFLDVRKSPLQEITTCSGFNFTCFAHGS